MNTFDIVSDFGLHFLRPWWWLALAPLPAMLWMLARNGGGRAALARLADAALLPHLVRDNDARRRFGLLLAALAWLLAVAALSGPTWQKVATPLYVNGAARVVALSLSNDMLAQDLKPDRMARARFAVRDLLDDAGDARTALVAYAGAAFTVAPLTHDKRTVLNLLRVLSPDVMPVPGNDAAAGIRQGVTLLRHAHVKGGEIVLVTDVAGSAAIDAARTAHATGIRVDVLGVGSTTGAPVPQNGGGFARGAAGVLLARRDDASLRAVANAGGGRYAVLQTDGGGVAALGAPLAASGSASRDEHAQVWRDGGVWLLPVLVILAALAFRRGWLLVIAIAVLPVAMPAAHATTWDSLWNNRDQRALQALQNGDAGRARKLATTPAMRGAAEYRAGDYADAVKAFAQGHDARSRYNLGNALAKRGEYRKAITAYQQALQQDPKFADARANLDAVEGWLKRHSPPSSGRNGNSRNQTNHAGQSGVDSTQSGSRQSQPSDSDGGSERSASPSSSAETSKGSQGSQPNASAATRDHGSGYRPRPDSGGASAAENARQRREAAQAAQSLQRELRGARDESKKNGGTPRAFELGQANPLDHSKLDAQQRAILHAVPDDPGALLRRKFQLEWEQRSGQQSGGGR